MAGISDAAAPWALIAGTSAAGVIGALLAIAFDRFLCQGRDWLAGKLSGLPTCVAAHGCAYCCVENGEPHRYAGCPANVRQLEREACLDD